MCSGSVSLDPYIFGIQHIVWSPKGNKLTTIIYKIPLFKFKIIFKYWNLCIIFSVILELKCGYVDVLMMLKKC